MEYVLQVGAPPKSMRATSRPRKYPFHDLSPGMWFFQPGAKPSTMMSLASSTGKRLGWKFETRQLYMRRIGGKWEQCEPKVKGATFGVAVYRTA